MDEEESVRCDDCMGYLDLNARVVTDDDGEETYLCSTCFKRLLK